MNMETGEMLVDCETGEMLPIPCINCETGEWEMNFNNRPVHVQKRPFRIPKDCLKGANCDEELMKELTKPVPCPNNASTKTPTKMNPVLFLLVPAFFIPAFGIILSIFEILIHMWAHKKNKTMRNSDKYYRSPFHSFICEFCKLCINENVAKKISKMQDRRNNRLLTKYGIQYVRRVVT